MPRRVLVLGVAVALAGLSAGCAGKVFTASRVAHYPNVVQQGGLTPAQRPLVEQNCGPFGMPEKDPGWSFGLTRFVARQGYAFEHSSVDKIPVWVCERILRDQLGGDLERADAFRADPELPQGERSELSDYKRSGYSRGHMAPAGDQTRDEDLKKETFFLSNMAPQLQRLNSPTWSGLEDLVRSWVANGKVEVEHVITGGAFYDPAEESPETADGQIEYAVIGDNRVAAPTHFYKIVLGRTPTGEWKGIGFFVPHNPSLGTIRDWTPYIRSVEWIQQRTGLDFFPQLSAAQRLAIEQRPSALW